VDQLAGIGIEKCTISNESDLSGLYNEIKNEGCIVEATIAQDTAFASFNPTSVNTIRAYSILSKNKVIITDAYLQMDVGDVIEDNFHSSGIAARIDVDTGIIITLVKTSLPKLFSPILVRTSESLSLKFTNGKR
jgi:hypothetical protein